MAIRLEGKTISARIKEQTAADILQLKQRGIAPCLAVVITGGNAAAEIYLRGKRRDCEECGVLFREVRLPESVSQQELLEKLADLAADRSVHGIMVELPLPAHINEKAALAAIPPEKDVDGASPISLGRLVAGEPCFLPCTAAACLEMIRATGEEIDGKQAVVVGRSNIVGKPAALLLLRENATVTLCHSHTRGLAALCAGADILVAAAGRAGLITAEMVKPGAVVVDAGINCTPEGKTCGDVDYPAAEQKAGYITPVPGGLGLVTRAVLLRNVAEAAKAQK